MPIGSYLGALGSGLGPGEQAGYDASLQQASDMAFGRTLQMLQQQQAPPPPGPPQGQMPQQPPMQMPMGGGGPPGQAPMGGAPPPMGQGSPPIRPPQMGGPVGAPSPQQAMGGPMGQPGNMPPQGMMPPQQQQPLQGQPQPTGWGQQGGQQQGGPLDWRQIFQAVSQANPGAPPQVIAGAVNRAIPLMNSQAQMEWKQVMGQIAQQRVDVQARGQDIRAETAQGAQDVARRGQDIRAQTATDNRISRETIAAAGLEGRQAMFEAGLISKQQMDEANRNERGREADQRTEVQREGIQTRAQTTERGQDIRADTAAKAESGRMARAELSADTKKEMGKLSIEARREIAAAAEAGKDYRTSYQEGARTQRAQLSADTRKEIATLSEQARKELTEYTEAGRMERSEQARTSRENVAAENRGERAREADVRSGQQQQRIDLQKSNLQTRIEAINTQRQIYGLPKIGEKEAAQIGTHSPAVTGADRIADQIVAGKKPPNTQGLGMHGGFQVQQSLATRYPEYDQTQATLEYEAARRTVMGMTSPQQVRFQQLGKAVVNTFDKVIEDARKMKLSGITPLNKADIDYLVNVKGNTPAGKLAATYLQDVAFLKGEVANLENGGYAPTESSWAQAKQVINENYGVDEMVATAHNAQRLIGYRLHALTELPGGRLGVGAGAQNPYLQPGAPSPHDRRGGNQDLGGGWSVQEH